MPLCQNCQTREGTHIWVGEGGTLAYVHGISARWCEHCVLEAQLTHARKMAAQIPDLEARLACVDATPPTERPFHPIGDGLEADFQEQK